MDTLVLNAAWMPITVIPWHKAITLWCKGKVDIVDNYDRIVHSPSTSMNVPSVVRYMGKHKGKSKIIKYSKSMIYKRDRGRCFVKGTKILMANGSQKSIEKIKIDDLVIDAYGNPQKVINIGSRFSDECVKIKFRRSNIKTIVTKDHPFLTPSGEFVEIGQNPEYLVFPRKISYQISSNNFFEPLKTILKNKNKIVIDNGWIKTCNSKKEIGVPLKIELTAQLAYIIGLFAAEGNCSKGGRKIRLSFNIKEKNTLAKEAIDFFTSIGYNPKYTEKTATNLCQVTVNSRLLCDMLNALIGVGVNKKTVWKLISMNHRDYLRGIFDGDGCINRKDKKVTLQLISKNLILGAQSMLWGLGIFPTIYTRREKGKKRTWSLILQGENYSRFLNLILGENEPKGEVIFGDNNFIFNKLQKNDNINGVHKVFNFEVSETNSYIANGVSVHNCQYCNNKVSKNKATLDHVLPRSRGGHTNFTNIVIACVTCNQRKKDRTPEEAKMRLVTIPTKPTTLPSPVLGFGLKRVGIPPQWIPYLHEED